MSTKDKATPENSARNAEAHDNTPEIFDDVLVPEKDAPKVLTLPPNILLLAIIAGLVLNWIFPLDWGRTWGGLGLIILILSLGLIFWCKKLFDDAGTNIRPDEPSLTLITEGPYMYSRNPVYLGFLSGFAGLAMLANAPIMLLILIPLFFALQHYVVKPEETYLEEKFGSEYRNYMDMTKRWITIPR